MLQVWCDPTKYPQIEVSFTNAFTRIIKDEHSELKGNQT